MPRRDEDDDDDFDDRPRKKVRRRDDDDDDLDDRPRKKKKAKKGGGVPVGLIVGGAVLLLLVAAGGAYLLFGGKGGKAGGGPLAGLTGPAVPPGYSSVGSEAGITVFLPGQLFGTFVRQGQNGPPNPNMFLAMEGGRGFGGSLLLAQRTPGFQHGSSVEQLFAAYEKSPFIHRPQKFEMTSKKAVTLGGKPGLEVRVKELPDIWDSNAGDRDFFKEQNDRERQRVNTEGVWIVVLVVPNGEWLYVISFSRKLQEPEAETVKTVADSIRF